MQSLLKGTLLQIDALNIVNTKKLIKTCVIFSVDNGADKIILPVVPSNLPDISFPQNNDTFNSIVADMSVIGTMGLRSMSFEGLLPADVNKYSWTYPGSNNAAEVINFINKYRQEYIPFRLTITQGDTCYLTIAVLINNFSYHVDGIGDYHYSLDLVEYRMIDPTSGGLVS